MNSYIVEFWSRVFGVLSQLSIFSVIRLALPKPVTAAFVDSWVLGHLLLSICCVFIAAYLPNSTFTLLLVLYGAIRVFEIAAYQINVLLFDEYRAFKIGKTTP